MMKSIKDFNLADKTTFIRVDYNVPLTESGEVSDPSRIIASLETLKYAISCGAKIILASHLGRPKGVYEKKYSMLPVAEKLSELLNQDVIFFDDCVGDGALKLKSELKPGNVVLLENLRFHKGETDNDREFAQILAKKIDVYINEAFGTVHRAHASVYALAELIPNRGAGFLIEKEVKFLGKLLKNPEKPFYAIIGGAKISDKIDVILNLLNKVQKIFIGGGMAYTFLKAEGKNIGNSLYEPDKLNVAMKIIERSKNKDIPIFFPKDHIIAKDINSVSDIKKADKEISEGYAGFDIGEKTIALFSKELSDAKTLFWNGPLGVFEKEVFSNGTFKIAEVISRLSALKVIGGGDSVAAVTKLGLNDKMDHISTGGGASLEFLEGKDLPGLSVLGYKN